MGASVLTADRILETAVVVLRRFGRTRPPSSTSRGRSASPTAVSTAISPARPRCEMQWLTLARGDDAAAGGGHEPVRIRSQAASGSGWTCWSQPSEGKRPTIQSCSPPTLHWRRRRAVVRGHVASLAGQAARIIADGVFRGEFVAANPVAAGRAVCTPHPGSTTRRTPQNGQNPTSTMPSRSLASARTRPRGTRVSN